MAREATTQNVTLELPLGLLTCVTGVPVLQIHPHQRHALSTGRHGAERGHTLKAAPMTASTASVRRQMYRHDQVELQNPALQPRHHTGIFILIRELFAGTQKRVREAINPGASVLMFAAGVAKPVR